MADDDPTFELSATHVSRAASASGPAKRAFVAVLEGATATTLPLVRSAPITIGRSRSCTVHVDDASVSRLQATLSWDGESGVWIEDHGSKNGTFVGAERVRGRMAVPESATVRIGPAQLAVLLPSVRREPNPARTRDRGFVAEDPAMEAVVQVLGRAASKNATVLLLGETGSGKEVMARWVHDASPRAAGPFVALNCGSLPESLAESTLFGHERGAFTGAANRHAGVFEQANKGTLFLDEIGELSAASQARLLRVLEDQRVTRLGATSAIAVDVRVVTATHRDLHADVASGRFREDLLYRIDVVRVRVPALRDRPDDVLALAEHFLASAAPGQSMRFAPDALDAFQRCRWPGNVRQLRNTVQRGVALASGCTITAADLGLELERPVPDARVAPHLPNVPDAPPAIERAAPRASAAEARPDLQSALEESEAEAITAALEACGGNQTHAAKRLGIARRTLIYKLEKYGLKPGPMRSR